MQDGLQKQALPWWQDLAWLAQRIVMRDPSLDALRRGRGLAAVPAHKSLYHTGNRTGLPIGNYTSQFFANVYLDQLDQFVKHELKAARYLRYVDDLVLIDANPEKLLLAEQKIAEFLKNRLQLELNPRSRRFGRVENGIDAFGYIVFCQHRYLRRRTARRFQTALNQAEKQIVVSDTSLRLQTGQAERLSAVCASYVGLMQHANCANLIKTLEARHSWAALLMQRASSGRLIRRYVAPGPHGSLAAQWWALRRLWPCARILLQVGTHLEAYGVDALWLQSFFGLGFGRIRAGFRHSAGFSCRARGLLMQIVAALDRPLLLLREVSGFQGAVRARELSVLFFPSAGEALPP